MYFIDSFQIRTVYGYTRCEKIADLKILADHIRREGLESIAKVSFYFTDTEYPDVFHNVILRGGEDGMFRVSDYPFEKPCNPPDLKLILEALRGCENLDELFVKHVIIPAESFQS